MEQFLLAIHHACNPLHVYCRLAERGVSRPVSLRLSSYYEILVFKLLNLSMLGALGLIRQIKRGLSILKGLIPKYFFRLLP